MGHEIYLEETADRHQRAGIGLLVRELRRRNERRRDNAIFWRRLWQRRERFRQREWIWQRFRLG
jgi:hypothetical protein